MKSNSNTIGKTAQLTNMSVETIRYYQRIGLINEPEKPNQGYRIYSQPLIDRLYFIKRAKQLGFSLTEISNLLELDTGQCDETKNIAQTKLSLINNKINDLTSLATELEKLIHCCEKNTAPSNCPIIKSIKINL